MIDIKWDEKIIKRAKNLQTKIDDGTWMRTPNGNFGWIEFNTNKHEYFLKAYTKGILYADNKETKVSRVEIYTLNPDELHIRIDADNSKLILEYDDFYIEGCEAEDVYPDSELGRFTERISIPTIDIDYIDIDGCVFLEAFSIHEYEYENDIDIEDLSQFLCLDTL